jgi:hypothetical protein
MEKENRGVNNALCKAIRAMFLKRQRYFAQEPVDFWSGPKNNAIIHQRYDEDSQIVRSLQ